ncbi:SDR family oxidoreductase [Novosphingobium sp. BL-52-GroH]|uniref:SDR family oxidoreductase n=1 Tax=Novosphingobium sp. BL-52-GroH TaxID=3349877 RepID=UPI003850A15B
MKQFEGKTALVSGSSQGIGKALAVELGRRGAAVTINYPRESEEQNAQAAVREIGEAGGRATAVMADISKVGDIVRLFDAAEAAHGKLDFVVANAGGNIRHATVLDTDEELWDAINSLNAKSTFFMFREGARRMNDGGRLIGLSSSTTRVVYPGTAAYAGCKSAIEMYCKTLSKEIGHRGITVNSVAPGMTITEGLRASTVPEERYELVKSITPLGRLGVAQDVADVILMLLGDDAGWVTGQHVNAGGGAFH